MASSKGSVPRRAGIRVRWGYEPFAGQTILHDLSGNQWEANLLRFQDIHDDHLKILVHTFYDQVREDELLGPIFQLKIGASWEKHMGRMVDFWSSVLLGTARFRGNPMLKHALIPDLTPTHFDRWMALFEVTVAELFEEEPALAILSRARNMRLGLERYSVAQPALSIVP